MKGTEERERNERKGKDWAGDEKGRTGTKTTVNGRDQDGRKRQGNSKIVDVCLAMFRIPFQYSSKSMREGIYKSKCVDVFNCF